MLRVAQTGLQLGVSCDLLPFGKTCQFSPRYNGIVELALASGVRAINADVVKEGDEFDYEKGTRLFLSHKKVAKSNGRITHAYALAEIKQGAFVFDVLDRDEIEQRRQQYSKSWKTQPLEEIPWYAKKTAVRRIAPLLPKNPRLAAALMFAAEEDEDRIPEAAFEVEPVAGASPVAAEPAAESAPTSQQLEDWEYQDDRHLV
jgi:phage RecT family recombinase